MNLKQTSVLLSRVALFVIYFWFGILKVIGISPASGLVQELFKETLGPILNALHLSFISPNIFVVVFGIIEIVIGILFIIPGKEKWAIYTLFAHMATTMLPLFFLKASAWQYIMVPTLEGQYIIKNIALIACAVTVWSSIKNNLSEKSSTPLTFS
jgi:uncharacterized membrane protein YkgB